VSDQLTPDELKTRLPVEVPMVWTLIRFREQLKEFAGPRQRYMHEDCPLVGALGGRGHIPYDPRTDDQKLADCIAGLTAVVASLTLEVCELRSALQELQKEGNSP